MTAENFIDLDEQRNARREGRGEDVQVKFNGNVYSLPAELPSEVFDPLLDMKEDLAGIVRAVATVAAKANAQTVEVVMRVLTEHPTLPVQVIDILRGSLITLFGLEQWERFQASRPSINDIFALFMGLSRMYGVGLGEASGSSASSESDGANSQPTTSSSTESTPDVSSVGQESQVVSA
jgi:hypothetical protein